MINRYSVFDPEVKIKYNFLAFKSDFANEELNVSDNMLRTRTMAT